MAIEGTKKKQPVAGVDDEGNYQPQWLWQCDSCGSTSIEQAGTVPKGWEVEDEADLLNTASTCSECLDDMDTA